MKTLRERLETRWRDGANLVLGLWLAVSPWVLGHLNVEYATWNAWAIGAIIAISALAALVEFHEWEEWVSAGLGAWLAVSPWVLGYSATTFAVWNHVAVGVITAGMACWSIWYTHQHPQREM
ncbi:MAG: SPW repeat protein [Gammaproteobacteria bacterium]|nr:MAG: SPW repeat protein [Gammaproteobacteria bacterium]